MTIVWSESPRRCYCLRPQNPAQKATCVEAKISETPEGSIPGAWEVRQNHHVEERGGEKQMYVRRCVCERTPAREGGGTCERAS